MCVHVHVHAQKVLGYLHKSLLMQICICRGEVKSLNLMKKFLYKFLYLTPAIIHTVLFCKVNITLLLGGITQKNYSMFHYGMKIGKIN